MDLWGQKRHPSCLASFRGRQEAKPFFISLARRDTVAVIQSYMRTSALSYDASRFGELTVCAKTGTAQVQGQSKPNAMLAGFVTDPDYPLAFVVCVESAGYGSDVCVPIAGKVLDACKAYME